MSGAKDSAPWRNARQRDTHTHTLEAECATPMTWKPCRDELQLRAQLLEAGRGAKTTVPNSDPGGSSRKSGGICSVTAGTHRHTLARTHRHAQHTHGREGHEGHEAHGDRGTTG